jgi:hypothetical protein
MQVGAARGVGPADEAVASGHQPRAGSKPEYTDDLAAAAGEVAQLGSGHGAGPKVMMVPQELVIDGTLGGGLHDFEADLPHLLRVQG